MIADDRQLTITLDRIGWFQRRVAHLRRTEANPAEYRATFSGFLAEIDRLQREGREFLTIHPTIAKSAEAEYLVEMVGEHLSRRDAR